MTINRYCASGLQSIALAADRIRGGSADVIVAGGTESMSYVPFGGNKISVNPWLVDNYPGSYMSMGLTAERVATHYGISREQMDQFSYESHQKALVAISSGKFEDEIVPITVTNTTLNGPYGNKPKAKPVESTFKQDEGPRADTSLDGPLGDFHGRASFNQEAAHAGEIILIAVKPAVVLTVIREIAPLTGIRMLT